MKEKKTVKKVTKKASAKTAEKKAAVQRKDGSVTLYNMQGKEVGTFELNKEIFDGKVHKAAVYHAIRMYNANKRQGNASTKTRGDVSGGGKKPFRQKGTGRARAGSTRSPLWRHGGSIFGPQPRDYHFSIPKKVRRLALVSSINSKLNEDKLLGIDAIEMSEPKTKNFAAMLNALKLGRKTLFILDAIDAKVRRASRNIPGVFLRNYKDFSALDVLSCESVVVSKAALEKLSERCGG